MKNFKTVLISAGACKYNEVLKISKLKNFTSKAILMHCVSSYPLEAKNANFVKFNYLKKMFRHTPVFINNKSIIVSNKELISNLFNTVMQELNLTASTSDTTELDNFLLLKQAPDSFEALAL